MMRPRVIPALLLKNQGLVKTVRFQKPTYVGDPINAVRIFNDKEVDELVFLDISATPERNEPQYELIERIATECFMPFCYGGGVRTLDQVRKLFSLGAEKVALNTFAAEDPGFVRKAADLFGSQSIIASIDVKRNLFGQNRVVTNGARTGTRWEPVAFAREMERQGAGEILLTSVDRDGTMQGYDLGLVRAVCEAVSVPVVACGGAGKLDDFAAAIEAGASAAAAGSMFVFTGPHRAVLISYPAPEELRGLAT